MGDDGASFVTDVIVDGELHEVHFFRQDVVRDAVCGELFWSHIDFVRLPAVGLGLQDLAVLGVASATEGPWVDMIVLEAKSALAVHELVEEDVTGDIFTPACRVTSLNNVSLGPALTLV